MEEIDQTYINLVSVEAFKNLMQLSASKVLNADTDFSRGLYMGMQMAYQDAMSRAESAGVHWNTYNSARKSLQSEKEPYIEPLQLTSSKHVAVAQVEA